MSATFKTVAERIRNIVNNSNALESKTRLQKDELIRAGVLALAVDLDNGSHDYVPPTRAVAQQIVDMLTLRQNGELTRGGDDFISGLVKAYALMIGVNSQIDALKAAKAEATR